jgi:hypothetical protein
MKLNRSSAVVEYKLVARLEKLRDRLRSEDYSDRLERPLAFWARPKDRRLPLAFMGRKVGDLLSTPFEELLATPGVGHKKLNSLVTLLTRIANDKTGEGADVDDVSEETATETARIESGGDSAFDPSSASEASWILWRRAVVENDLADEKLGRFTPSLQHLPRVLWETPLSDYTDLTLEEIRQRKTHGTKRVNAVLEVFAQLYRVLGRLGPQATLAVRIVPRFVNELEDWVLEALEDEEIPSAEAIREKFIAPMLAQIRIDAGDQIAQLAEHRLGLDERDTSVRQEARRLGLTRARVYQLLADIGAMMHVRWPEGAGLVGQLCKKCRLVGSDQTGLTQLYVAADLFFPGCNQEETDIAEKPGTGVPPEVSQRRHAG